MPTVSVIVPCYNHASYLHQRIESILGQTFQDFELILLDDCSTDGSRAILDTYRSNPHVTHVVYNSENSGSPFSQWAKGIALAKGEWVWIAESDDISDPDQIEVLTHALRMHPECGIGYVQARYIEDEHVWWTPPENNRVTVVNGRDYCCRRLIFRNEIFNVGMCLFRKSIYDIVDHTRYEQMNLCGDWMLYAMVCSQTHVLEVGEAHCSYRIHEGSASQVAVLQGKTFTEGICVVDYIANTYHLPARCYSRHWGREWAKQQYKYNFDSATLRSIKQAMGYKHWLIIVFYHIYRIRLLCRR